MRSDYTYKVIDNLLLIIDNCGINNDHNYMSVTNNMENVLNEITEKEFRDISLLNIYYRDTLFNWDQIYIKSMFEGKITDVDFALDSNIDGAYLDTLYFK